MSNTILGILQEKGSEKLNQVHKEIIDKVSVDCGNCNKPLIDVILVKKSERENYILASCPYCGDSSFKNKILGNIYIEGANGLKITDTKTEIDHDTKNNTNYIRVEK